MKQCAEGSIAARMCSGTFNLEPLSEACMSGEHAEREWLHVNSRAVDFRQGMLLLKGPAWQRDRTLAAAI